jgi:hypothetical protein
VFTGESERTTDESAQIDAIPFGSTAIVDDLASNDVLKNCRR